MHYLEVLPLDVQMEGSVETEELEDSKNLKTLKITEVEQIENSKKKF